MMSKMKKMIAVMLVLIVALSVSMPAFAATNWYTYQCGCNRTRTFNVRVTRYSNANRWLSTRLLTQADGSINMRHDLTRRWIVEPAKGTYYVTVTQTRDAYNRPVNKRICTNRFWSGQYFNINMTAGQYTVSIRSAGVSYSLVRALQGYNVKSWHVYPRYKFG